MKCALRAQTLVAEPALLQSGMLGLKARRRTRPLLEQMQALPACHSSALAQSALCRALCQAGAATALLERADPSRTCQCCQRACGPVCLIMVLRVRSRELRPQGVQWLCNAVLRPKSCCQTPAQGACMHMHACLRARKPADSSRETRA